MKVFRRIVHATDFSSASRPAFARAISVARQNRAALWVVPALPPLMLTAGSDVAYLPFPNL
jgi:nucleotide-binding universal stress UspA family protein